MLAALFMAVPALAAACGPEGPEDTAPLVSEGKMTPTNLPFQGGTAAVSARVEDDCGIQQVYAEVSASDGSYYESIQLLPYEVIDSQATIYRGEFQARENFSEEAIGYQATVLAEDTNGAYAEGFGGELEVAAVPQFDEPPYVSKAAVTPESFDWKGGYAKVSMRATDNRGVSYAFALVTSPGKPDRTIDLEPTDFDRFEGDVYIPANASTQAREWTITAYAQDDIGQETGEPAGTVTVGPKAGSLLLEPRPARFGIVALGRSVSRSFTITNTGAAGSPTVTGHLKSPDSQFTFAGEGASGLAYSLAPGESQTVEINFRPTAIHGQSTRIPLGRDDGLEAWQGIPASGWGVRNTESS